MEDWRRQSKTSPCCRRTTALAGGGECLTVPSPLPSSMELDAAHALADLSRVLLPPCSTRSDSRKRMQETARPRSTKQTRKKISSAPKYTDAKSLVTATGDEAGEWEFLQRRPGESRSNYVRGIAGSRAKSGRIWSEAEKEERRMRRVLANRESARETIRRRQAFRDWLAGRVSDLSLDNGNLKTEKELLVKEYRSLIDTNKQLKRMADPQLTLDDLMKVGDDAAANDSSFYGSADTSSSFGGCQEKCEWLPLLYGASPATCSWIRSSVHLQTPCLLPQSADASRSPMATMAAVDVATRKEEVSMVAIGQQFCGKGGKSSGCHKLTRSFPEMTSAAAEARKTRKELIKLKHLSGGQADVGVQSRIGD